MPKPNPSPLSSPTVVRGRYLHRHRARVITRGNLLIVEFLEHPWYTDAVKGRGKFASFNGLRSVLRSLRAFGMFFSFRNLHHFLHQIRHKTNYPDLPITHSIAQTTPKITN